MNERYRGTSLIRNSAPVGLRHAFGERVNVKGTKMFGVVGSSAGDIISHNT